MNVLNTFSTKVKNFFQIEERKSTIVTELRAGVVTFLTMAYILAVNAAILTDSGGTCKDPFNDTKCMEDLRIDLIYATAISAGVSTLLMGLTANLPLALAPGMGLNAYFTYDVVGFYGTGKVSYRNALFATFIEGLIFLAMSVTGFRFKLMNLIPQHIKYAMSVGIGLFLAHIGLQSAEGIGLVTADLATGITLGGCDLDKQVCFDFSEGDWTTSGTGGFCQCLEGTMEGPTTWLGIAGFVLMSVLIVYKVKGAMFLSIMAVTILSWFRNTAVTYFPDNDTGDSRYQYFKDIVDFHSFDKTPGAAFESISLKSADIWVALVTFLYVDILDTAGTLFSMAEFAGLMNEDGTFPGQTMAFTSDAVGTIVGACLGTSSVTTYIESGAGIEEGGRTGLTAVVVALLFFLSLIFAPILASIPPWATGPALILIGSLMVKTVKKINWDDMKIAIPSFITIILMPLTYSIAYGVIGGLGTHLCISFVDTLVTTMKQRCCSSMETGETEEEEEEKEDIELQTN